MNPGDTLEQVGPYELLKLIGTGGMAEVYLAQRSGTRGFIKPCVVKRIRPEMLDVPESSQMFLTEARTAAMLQHGNIVQVLDYGVADGRSYLAMEWVDGLSVWQLDRRARDARLRVPASIWLRIVSECCHGLAYAHALTDPRTGKPLGLVHRDVSPDNILVSREGSVQVSDWGIAKAREQTRITKTGHVVGKPSYMSAEHARGERLDCRTDVFSLGIVLYELLAGAHPFGSSESSVLRVVNGDPHPPMRKHRPDLPPEVDQIFDRALAHDREARYPDCEAFAEELRALEIQLGLANSRQIGELVEKLMRTGAVRRPGTVTTAPEAVVAVDPGPVTKTLPGRTPRASLANTLPEPRPGPRKTATFVGAQSMKVAPMLATTVAVVVVGFGGWWGWQRFETRAPAVAQAPAPPAPTPAAPPAPAPAPPASPTPPAPATRTAPEAPSSPVADSAPARAAPTRHPLHRRQSPGEETAALGKVDFRVFPYGTVYLDGKLVGDAPFPPVEIPAGHHRVLIANPSLNQKVEREVQVEVGQTSILRVNLQDP